MELVNTFTVNRPIDEAWAIVTDLERIAPCLPGAQLQEIEGDIYRGVVKVKVGPISAAMQGEASFLERDDANHKAVLKGEGRDIKGNGNASAIITATLQELTPTSAKCVVHTDLSMTGKVSQFGRGALGDISSKLMKQFAKNLDEMLAKDSGPSASMDEVAVSAGAMSAGAVGADADAVGADAVGADAVGADTAGAKAATPAATKSKATKAAKFAAAPTPPTAPETPVTSIASDAPAAGVATPTPNTTPTSTSASTSASPRPSVRKIEGPAAEPIDAFSLGGNVILKRLLPALGGLVLLIVALRRLRK